MCHHVPVADLKQKFYGIEVLRGLAALLIVLHHCSSILGEPRYSNRMPFHVVLGEFHLGVDFFFVLSGFIIAWVHEKDMGQRFRLRPYFIRRFTRIYPAYWALLIPLTLLYHALPHYGDAEKHVWGNFVFSFFLLPSNHELILGVAWTLVYEVFFYLLFGVLMALGRSYLWLLPIWAAGIILWAVYGDDNHYMSFFFNAYDLNFLLGIAAALVLRRQTISYAWFVMLAGGGCFLLAMVCGVAALLEGHDILTRLLFGSTAALTLLGIVELERSGRLRVNAHLQILGAASYSIYLVHPLALSFFLVAAWPFLKTMP